MTQGQNQNAVPLVGQPFTLENVSMPVNALLTCKCVLPGTPLQVIASAPVTCPFCKKVYVLVFNPQNGQLAVGMGDPADNKKVDS